MRRLTPLLIAALLFLPVPAAALRAVPATPTNPPPLLPAVCNVQGATGDPTETKAFVDGVATDLTIKQFLIKHVACASA